MTCRCGESNRVEAKHFFRRTVAGTTFTADADVDSCAGCGEVHIPASLMIAFERAIAGELARRGPVTDETFRWIRKAAGLERGELAQILGVTPETIAGWEGERRPIDRAAWMLVAAMVLDSIEGPRAMRTRIKGQRRNLPAPAELPVALPVEGTIARVLMLMASSLVYTDADISDALDIEHQALRAHLRDWATLGLVSPSSDADEHPSERVWTPVTRDGAALIRAAIDAGVDVDAPLPRAAHGDAAKSAPRARTTTTTWRLTSS